MRIINFQPKRNTKVLVGLMPILLLVTIYLIASAMRHSVNSVDKLLPTISQMADAIGKIAFHNDVISGKNLFIEDTLSSLFRLGLGLIISVIITMLLGLVIGMMPLMRAGFGPLIATIAFIPPIAILPILFIIFGLGEVSKVMLIVIGITPFMVRDIAAYLQSLPKEQIIKAQTLGAGSWLVILRIALPQMMPRLVESLRFAIGPAFVYLISAEAIAADVGLGYRIFLMRRYLAMDIILPYVAWISIISVAMDSILNFIAHKSFKWKNS